MSLLAGGEKQSRQRAEADVGPEQRQGRPGTRASFTHAVIAQQGVGVWGAATVECVCVCVCVCECCVSE